MRLILPLVLALLGVVGGGALGMMLKPEPTEAEAADKGGDGDKQVGDKGDAGAAIETADAKKSGPLGLHRPPQRAADSLYVPIAQKLIVPTRGRMGRKAFVALDATLEVAPEKKEWVSTHEPKTIDAFLRVMIAFAATGAFEDHQQTAMALEDLNDALLTAAQAVLGEDAVRAVLIANLVTQEA